MTDNDYIPDLDTDKSVAIWLYICCFSVFLMAIIGAVTRLTDSGLSMVEWKPIMGAIPPLDQDDWMRVFDLYKETPQFKDINFDMELSEFKNIFFWEWFHRFFGRMIGVIYALPFVFFLIRKKIPFVYLPSLIGFLILGAMQGVMGWYMVKSGLVDNPEVSHFRLAAHLGLAFIVFGLMFNTALKLTYVPLSHTAQISPLKPHIGLSILLMVITMTWGAFVAGLDAGHVYNSFPLMGKYPWPSELFDMRPIWDNFIHGKAGVQFIHRVLAFITAFSIISLWFKSKRFNPPKGTLRLIRLSALIVFIQISLGVSVLLTDVSIHIAATHQATAFILLAMLIWVSYEIPDKRYSEDVDGYE